MKKHICLTIAFMLVSVLLSAQTPLYLTKAYKPVESDRYKAYSSLEIQEGDTQLLGPDTMQPQICKAVKLFTKGEDVASGSEGWRIPYTLGQYKYDFDDLKSMKENAAELLIQLPAANDGLLELGLGAISYGKIVKATNKMLPKLKKIIDEMYRCARENEAYLVTLLNSAVDIDGRVSTERTIFAPLLPGETPPPGETAKVRNFSE